MVPAVAYGPGTPVRHLAIDPKTFLLARTEYGLAHLFDVNVDGEEGFKALIKATSQNPINRELLHVDLYAVDMKAPVRVKIRVDLEGKAKGEVLGGQVQQVLRRFEVECLPGNIPEKVVLDISDLGIDDSIHINDVSLPDGVKATSVNNETIVVVRGGRGVKKEEEAGGEAASA